MHRQILIPSEEVSQIVAEVAKKVDGHYDDRSLGIFMLGVLKGGITFTSDLGQELWRLGYEKTTLGFVQSSSYGKRTVSSGNPNLAFLSKREDIEGKHILVIEDLIDNGFTLKAILKELAQFFPASLAVATLLAKPDNQKIIWPDDIPLFIGRNLKGKPWVDGRGIDSGEENRFSPDIGVQTEEPMTMEEARAAFLVLTHVA
ncbi:MAG: phosphoribosyltransferase family protein [Patescibacteria group bacterium]